MDKESTEKLNEIAELSNEVVETSNEVTPIEAPADVEQHTHGTKDGVSFKESLCMCATCTYCPMK